MGEASTDKLRQLAPKWSLAGDDTLLTILQNTHQKIVSKCQEVNTKLEEMVASLDDASIHVQNVNNKFMSLSNRQFIESRVYDDDADLTTDVQANKESPQPSLPDELSMLKNSLAILDAAHEITEIIDDSDSDSDAEISVVLKPKDMYANRPMPYIMGTQQWKNKWHAGLIIENSDSESVQSKENTDVEYSDTDVDEQTDRQIDNTISESSSLHSDRVPELNPHTAAQVAASIASVMAQTQPVIERPVTPPTPKEYLPRKPPTVYKPQQPVTSTVFSDEPPPLDQYDTDSSEQDIFAEINKINKNKPLHNKTNNVADDLFGIRDNSAIGPETRGPNPVEELFGNGYDEDEPQPVMQKPPVFQRQSEPIETQKPVPKEHEENMSKKPIGGISLFGSNKNTDTIGAAILKRNLRRSSTSDESGSEEVKTDTFKPKTVIKDNIDELDNKVAPKKENKDIFEDLFSKKVQKEKDKDEKTFKNEIKKQEYNLFSDNIFDDVDDIFTSNVKVTSKTAQQSLFESDDDLFNDIAKPKVVKPSTSKEIKSKTVEKLFESDDELFSDLKSDTNTKKGATGKESIKIAADIKKVETSEQKPTKIETKKGEASKEKSTNKDSVTEKVSTNTYETKPTETKSTKTDPPTINNTTENVMKAKSIFDSDSDDDIFSFNKPNTPKSHIENSSAMSIKDDNKFQSPLLFDDDDEIDDLFNNSKSNNVAVPINNKEINTNSKIERNFDSSSKPLESKTQHSIDKSVITTDTKEVIEKEPLETKGNGSKSEVTIKQSGIDINVQDTNILDKENDVLNNVGKSPKLFEERSGNEKKKNNSELIKPQSKDERSDAKEVLPTEVPILNDLLISNENVVKDDANDEDLSIEPLTNEPNKNENLQEAPIFSKPSIENQKVNDITLKTEENLSNKSFGEQSSIDLNTPKVPEDVTESMFNDEPNVKDDFPIPNENLPQASEVPENVPSVPHFDDILTEPPAFEKAKEPKKSKNVNALFDDDSEDEALFFKKNDVISDVKPDIFSQNANFGLFIDEPPAIDDFDSDLFNKNDDKDSIISKKDGSKNNDILTAENDLIGDNKASFSKNYGNESKTVNLDKVLQDPISDNTIKTNLPKDNLFHNSSDEELFTEKIPKLPDKSLDGNGKNKSKTIETPSIFDDLDDNLFTTKNTDNIFNQETPKNITEDVKKIGKLNTQNININVQALIPGASPKKVKIDTQNTEPKSVEIESKIAEVPEIPATNISEITNAKMVKSISFEDSPDADVLDNNASKKRAKIQVKRRPSSRRARHEAVRKSIVDTDKVLDIDNEDLDTNKGFLDIDKEGLDTKKGFLDVDRRDLDAKKGSLDTDKVRNKVTKESVVDTGEKIKDTEGIKKKEQSEVMKYKDELDIDRDKQVLDGDKTCLNTEAFNYKEHNETVTKLEQSIDNTVNIENISDNNRKNNAHEAARNENTIQEKSTKIVYVLNDEDIFQTNKKDLVETSIKTKDSTKIETNKISLFDNEQSDRGETSQTKKDKTYNEKAKTKISLFDSDDEDDKSMFKTKPIVKKTKLFDSDSDDDLFGSAKTKNIKTKDTVIKKSLFDDENEDGELFGAKNDKTDKKSTASTSKQSAKNTIFADPLSLFGDD